MTILKQILLEKNLSQNKLSQQSRVPQNMISLIVTGKMYPCPAWRNRISQVLEIPEAILFPKNVAIDDIGTDLIIAKADK